eukprot:1177775-Prorocentrum_minimum.AAC.2
MFGGGAFTNSDIGGVRCRFSGGNLRVLRRLLDAFDDSMNPLKHVYYGTRFLPGRKQFVPGMNVMELKKKTAEVWKISRAAL